VGLYFYDKRVASPFSWGFTPNPKKRLLIALAPNLNTTNQLNIQVKAIDIQAGYDGSLNESYTKTSSSSSGFLAIVPSTSARLTFTFLCLE
jgi:hypothetical protein